MGQKLLIILAKFLIGSCLFAINVVAFAEVAPTENTVKYLHKIWQAEEGLPSPIVRAVLQTRDGYLWVVTQDGVVRFDGVRFTTPMDVKQGLEFDKARQYFALAETADGSVWTSTTHGLARMRSGRVTYYTAKDGLPDLPEYVLTVYEDKKGVLWAGSTAGLYRFAKGKFHRVWTLREDRSNNIWIACENGFGISTNTPLTRFAGTEGFLESEVGTYNEHAGVSVHAVRNIFEDSAGTLWVGTSKGVLQIKKDVITDYFLRENSPDRLPHNAIQCIHESRDGSLWIATSRGLARWKNGDATIYGEDSQNGLDHETVRAIYEDAAGVLWLGTFRGIQQFVDGKFLRISISGDMAADFGNIVPGYAYSICGDREGDIWVGSSSGLNRLKKQTFETFSKNEGLLTITTTSVLESRSGDIWIGTYGGGLSQLRDGTITNLRAASGFSRILALCEDKKGNLWIGTENYGLYRLTDGKLTDYPVSQIADTVIKVIYEDSKGMLWIGGPLGLTRYKDGKFEFYSKGMRLANGAPLVLTTVKTILEDRKGNLWVGSKEGLTRIREDSPPKHYGGEKGAPQEMVNALHEDSDGVVWIGTEAGRLFSLAPDSKPERFVSYAKEATSGTNMFARILHILEDDNQNLWMSTRNGIFRISKKELRDFALGVSTNIISVSYGRLDGMRRAQCNGIAQPSGWKARDGRMWFPTLAGVVAIDVKNIQPNLVKPPVIIEKVLVDGKEIERGEKTVIPPGKSQVEFQYTALSFQLPEKIRFKYLLDGNDSRWQDVGSKRAITFLNLSPGKYTFHVSACNNEGVWNATGDSFEFSLAPRFYETFSFYAFCIAGVAIILWVLVRVRVRTLQRRHEELERTVAERTQSLQQEITERRATESALKESQQMVLRQERLSAVGQLSAGIAHEFNNILTVIQGHTAFLLGNPNLDEGSKKSLKHISTGVERTAKLTQQMLTFSRRQIMQQQVMDLNDAINHVTTMLGRLLGENIRLRCELDPNLPTVNADPGMIDQIVTNLAVNARDAMPKGGELAICTKAIELTKIDASSHADAYPGKFVCLSVSDTGCGMDADTVNRIFEPFFTTKGVGKGTGLGLATVYGIVKQHKGWIEVSSKVGQGTTFKICFPVSGKISEAAPAKLTLPKIRGGQETILIVEDETELRELIREILGSHGYRILEAGNALEALAVWERERGKIDLLLTDMMMPGGMNGRDLAEKLHAANPNLPVIYSSGYSKEMMEKGPDQRNGVAFLSKPYHPAKLAQTVRDCLDASNGSTG